MAPLKYYRVQDNSSATYFDVDDGFVAGDPELPVRMFPRNDSEERDLSNALDRHLDWYDTTPSPFISVYTDLDTARVSANARVKQGKRGVFIAHIDVKRIGGLYYRNVRGLADEIELEIQPQALNNSRQEFIFLHHIPEEAVTRKEYFS